MEMRPSLATRGIEFTDDWHEYVQTMERDGDIIAELYHELNADTMQLVSKVRKQKCAAEETPAVG